MRKKKQGTIKSVNALKEFIDAENGRTNYQLKSNIFAGAMETVENG